MVTTNRRLETDIAESRDVCPYATGCPLLTTTVTRRSEEVSDRYETICSTERRYDCSQFAARGVME